MISLEYLRNTLLVASPLLRDPVYERSVLYIYEHNVDGAIGIVVNKPLHVNLYDVLKNTSSDITASPGALRDEPVLLGGPINQDNGFIVYFDISSGEIEIASSIEILEDISKGKGPERRLVALGYCGWEAGQLEEELMRNDWLITPASEAILFDTPLEQRWNEALKLLGVHDIYNFSGESGNV